MKRVVLIGALALMVVMALCSPALAESPTSYTLTQAHIYKALPGSAEWGTYFRPEQKLAACYVDPAELAKMTTPALVETVLTYPLLIDIFAFDSLEEGIKIVSTRFAGIDELASRSDALQVLQGHVQKNAFATATARLEAEAVLTYLQGKSEKSGMDGAIILSGGTPSHVSTPEGTLVDTVRDGYYPIGPVASYADAVDISQDYQQVYPSTQWLYNPSAKYNCHSFAWYSAYSSNRHWMDDPSAYMSDGSYISWVCIVGGKMFYNDYDGNGDHSAIVTALPSGGNPAKVKSKWGCLAAFTHYYTDCPYINYFDQLSIWKRP